MICLVCAIQVAVMHIAHRVAHAMHLYACVLLPHCQSASRHVHSVFTLSASLHRRARVGSSAISVCAAGDAPRHVRSPI